MRGAWPLVVLTIVALLLSARPAAAQEPLTIPAPPTPPQPAPLGSPLPVDPPQSSLLSGLSLTGEILYLWPNRDGLGMAMVSNGMGFSSLESLSWGGTPAFRVGACYRLPESEMDFGAAFTYFHAKTQHSASAPDGGSLLGTLATVRGARDATDADGDAGLSYAVLDLDVGKSARVSDSLVLRAFGGVRLASINQTLKCIYTGGSLGDAADYVNSPIHFLGAGLTAGAESTWNIYRGWGLYGRGRMALLSGSFDSRRTETLGSSLIDDESEKYFTVIPVVELGAGLSYQGERFFFRAGYEVTDWINMVSGIGGPGSNGSFPARKRGDLTLEALSLKFGFAF